MLGVKEREREKKNLKSWRIFDKVGVILVKHLFNVTLRWQGAGGWGVVWWRGLKMLPVLRNVGPRLPQRGLLSSIKGTLKHGY